MIKTYQLFKKRKCKVNVKKIIFSRDSSKCIRVLRINYLHQFLIMLIFILFTEIKIYEEKDEKENFLTDESKYQ